jgi:hypothetical protein
MNLCCGKEVARSLSCRGEEREGLGGGDRFELSVLCMLTSVFQRE